ncbi:MAG TPA: hypothetical protein PLR83_03995 [Pyrinomonadaceae bacterium]|nr:hypothetical protein [Pyrinomonadaceae bacterium]
MSPRRLEFILYFSGLLFLAAFAYFFRADDADWTFPMFILAVSMFFLGYRFRLKARIDARPKAMDPAEPKDEPHGS